MYAMTVSCDLAVNSSLTLSATTTVYINIIDINDNGPIFTNSSYVASVAEDANVGDVVTTVTANDVDTGTAADVGCRVHAARGIYLAHL